MQNFEAIPSVTDCLLALNASGKLQHVPPQRVKHCVRLYLERIREDMRAGKGRDSAPIDRGCLYSRLENFILRYHAPRMQRVINGTGVILHTNLGRSLLPQAAIEALALHGQRYSNLEFNLESGQRGSRYSHVEDLLCEITGCEAALVVNNNAAAVFLALETLAKGKEVVVSRGQLVEIGGSFRVPDVMARSGARLVEVGTTNRTHLKDYAEAVTSETGLLMRVHCSNFRVIGFTSEVSGHDLVQLARQHGLPVMEDLGSGSFVDFSDFGLLKEPTVQEVVKSGMDVVTFSGDKLLGGPQAGIIVGRASYIDTIKRNPLNRALRVDKLTIAALEAVLRIYLDPKQAMRDIPTLAMIAAPPEKMKERAQRFIQVCLAVDHELCQAELVSLSSCVGGGALPEQHIASWGVALRPTAIKAHQLEDRLRQASIPVVGRVEEDRLLLDMRTMHEDEIDLLVHSLHMALSDMTKSTKTSACSLPVAHAPR